MARESESGRAAAGKVLVWGPPGESYWAGLARLGDLVDFVVAQDEPTLARELEEAEVLFVWSSAPDLERLWPRARRLRWVHSGLAGINNLLFPALVESEVKLSRSQGVYADSLAEYALAAMLYFAKRLPQMVEAQRRHEWRKVAPADLRGATLGVVGLGDIGGAVARRAKAFGMHVLGLRRTGGPTPEGVDELLPLVALPALLERSDYVVITLPLTPATRGLIGEREFASCKPGAVLIDIARGGIVEETALLAALRGGRLGGAAMDVFAREPLPPDNPLWDAPNLLISAHTVDNVPGWEARVIDRFVENYRLYAAGRPLPGLVDKRRGY